MTGRQLAAMETKKKLLAAAKRLIGERGLADVAVEEITGACGVAKGTFYTYFKKKEDIVFELSEEMFGEILENAINAAGGAAEKLKNYMSHFSECIEKSGVKLAQEWVRGVVEPPKDGSEKTKLASDLADMRTLLLFLEETQKLREGAAAALAGTLVDLAYGQMLCWCMTDGQYSLKGRTEAFCEEYLPALLQKYII